MTKIVYDAPPTCARFMRSDSFGRLIAGPVGSGKTTACIFEMFRRASEQEKAADGLRYTRFAIVRQTLKQLKDTVLKDIIDWLERGAHYKVSDSTVYIEVGDIRSEWILIPLDDLEDQRRLLSMQLTGAWMSECIEMDLALVAPLSGRIGRYPSGNRGGATWSGIIADTNMPAEGTDWHTFMNDGLPGDWQIFIQPSGMSAEAENLNWLAQTADTKRLPLNHPERLARGREYYNRMVRMYGENSDWVKRYVYAQFGSDPSGTAVFRETFRADVHVVDTEGGEYAIDPVFGHPIIVSQDFGRDPCSLIGQVDHKGRLLILEEVIAEDIGLELHVQRALKPALMHPRFVGKPIAMVGDPAGRAKSTIYEESSFDALKRYGFVAFPAPTNDVEPRLRAVDAYLTSMRDGGPAILIDKKRCPTLVRALGGGYRYARTKSGQRKPLPEKNKYSHIADCLQYLCVVAHGGLAESIGMSLRQPLRRNVNRPSARAWT